MNVFFFYIELHSYEFHSFHPFFLWIIYCDFIITTFFLMASNRTKSRKKKKVHTPINSAKEYRIEKLLVPND